MSRPMQPNQSKSNRKDNRSKNKMIKMIMKTRAKCRRCKLLSRKSRGRRKGWKKERNLEK